MIITEKFEKLKEIIEGYGSVGVAFSGGVDSTFLLKIAHDVLGENAVALTIVSPLFPERENDEAVEFCKVHEIKQILIPVDILAVEGFEKNPSDRCYVCKKNIFSSVLEEAVSEGIIIIAEGSNIDDDSDYRPGMQAVKEIGIQSPLKDAGLTKHEIRVLSKELSLDTWNKPSFACLATRFVYGDTITKEKLVRIDQAEQFLIDNGFSQVRVRIHGDEGTQARIEVLPEDFSRLLEEEIRNKVYEYFKGIGFENISLDIRGYRTGSMNESLEL